MYRPLLRAIYKIEITPNHSPAMSVVTPNQIIEAVQFAKAAGDPHAAFRITLGGDKLRKNTAGTVAYMTWEVNIATATGREWRKVAIRVANLATCSSAKPSPYNKVQTMFRVGSTYKVGEVVQQLGEAMHLMNGAWQHHIAAVLRTTAATQKNKTVHPLVQDSVGNPPKSLEKAEHMFRVEIKFPQDKPKSTGDKPGGRQQQAQKEAPKDDAVPAIVIRDASKRVGADFAPATMPDGSPLTYITLQHFITNGSSVSGVIDASEVILSTMGCSLPLSWTLLIVKHVKAGREVTVADGLGDFASEIAGGGDAFTGEADPTPAAASAAPAAAASTIKAADLDLAPPEDEDEEGGEGEEEPEEEEEDTPAPVAPPPAAKPRAKPAAKKP